MHSFYNVSQQQSSSRSISQCSENTVYHLYCYISPETGYFFPDLAQRLKVAHCTVVSRQKKRKRESSHRSQTSRGNGESGDKRPILTSYVTSSPRSASVMRILEIFSQGPWSTRVTSGYSSSLSRVFSLRLRREKTNDIIRRK